MSTLAELFARAGAPVPCSNCGELTSTRDLTETVRPGAIADFGPGCGDLSFVVDTVVWICRACRRDGFLAAASADGAGPR